MYLFVEFWLKVLQVLMVLLRLIIFVFIMLLRYGMWFQRMDIMRFLLQFMMGVCLVEICGDLIQILLKLSGNVFFCFFLVLVSGLGLQMLMMFVVLLVWVVVRIWLIVVCGCSLWVLCLMLWVLELMQLMVQLILGVLRMVLIWLVRGMFWLRLMVLQLLCLMRLSCFLLQLFMMMVVVLMRCVVVVVVCLMGLVLVMQIVELIFMLVFMRLWNVVGRMFERSVRLWIFFIVVLLLGNLSRLKLVQGMKRYLVWLFWKLLRLKLYVLQCICGLMVWQMLVCLFLQFWQWLYVMLNGMEMRLLGWMNCMLDLILMI